MSQCAGSFDSRTITTIDNGSHIRFVFQSLPRGRRKVGGHRDPQGLRESGENGTRTLHEVSRTTSWSALPPVEEYHRSCGLWLDIAPSHVSDNTKYIPGGPRQAPDQHAASKRQLDKALSALGLIVDIESDSFCLCRFRRGLTIPELRSRCAR